MRASVHVVPCVVNGKRVGSLCNAHLKVLTKTTESQVICTKHADVLATVHQADSNLLKQVRSIHQFIFFIF